MHGLFGLFHTPYSITILITGKVLIIMSQSIMIVELYNRTEITKVFFMEKRQEDENRRKMGRPRKNPDQARSNRIVTFVTNAELAKLDQVAGENKMSLSAVVHKSIRDFLYKI